MRSRQGAVAGGPGRGQSSDNSLAHPAQRGGGRNPAFPFLWDSPGDYSGKQTGRTCSALTPAYVHPIVGSAVAAHLEGRHGR
jgi:hypothetical protein